MEWITTNWVGIIAVIGGIVTLASAIVKLTPTPKDDAIVSWIRKLLEALALTPKK